MSLHRDIKHHEPDDYESEQLPKDMPPPYEINSSGPTLASSFRVNDQGTVDIDFSGVSAEQVDLCLPPIERQHNVETTSADDTPCPPINVVIHVVGSRGDVQPFLALGVALKKYGHRVRLATHDIFADFIRSSGLEFYPVGGDPEDLMAYMVKNPGLIPSVESLRGGDVGRKRNMMREMLKGFWRSCISSDLLSQRSFVADAIIANPPSFAHVHCAEALGIPIHMMFTMPWTATRAFPHPLANLKSQNMDPRAANYLSYGVVDLMTWQGLGDVINAWRIKELDLEKLPSSVGPDIIDVLKIPYTYCWSPTLVPKPIDWGNNIDICGFFLRSEPSFTPPQDLAAFLQSGSVPLYIGFGSIVIDDPTRMTAMILQACSQANVRVILSRGWSKLGGSSQSTNDVFYLDDCPHEWLFKRVRGVIHHGGAGTTACGLVNGQPTAIVPFFGDQPFWGRVVAGTGAGPMPIAYRELSVDKLTDAIRFCRSTDAKVAAESLAVRMRQENGVEAAIRSFHRHLLEADFRCEVVPECAARWVYTPKKSKQRNIKLSNEALTVLSQHKLIDRSRLEPLRSKRYHVENERWDPLTAGASATLGTMTNFTSALGGTFIDPFIATRRVRDQGADGGTMSRAAFNAAGSGLKGMGTSITKGTLVDFPLALAEGLRNTPALYGERVERHNITDWKSGSVVAAKNFGVGFYEGITGVVTRPMEGAKKEGTIGALKGVGKGTVELITKPGSAMFGLMGYPAQGIYKSARSLSKTTVQQAVFSGRTAMLEEAQETCEIDPRQVIERFYRMR